MGDSPIHSVDRGAAVNLMVRSGALAGAHTEVAKAEISPSLARPSRAVALDSRVYVGAGDA